MAIKPGFCIGCKNYEADVEGYTRVQGYERFDGRLKPSEASYETLAFAAGSTEVVAGDVVTGATSSASGIALQNGVLESGTYGGADATGYLVLVEISGTFANGEDLQVSAAKVAESTGTNQVSGASTVELNTTYQGAAIERRRGLIAEVPGSGPVRGVATFKGDVYAWRDNAGATACVMHKATSSGWVAQTFGHTLAFTSGGTAFVEGSSLNGGTSLATATIDRVVKTSGNWGTSDAAGYMVLSSITGTFQSGESLSGSGGGAATSGGAQVAVSLPPGGKYRTRVENFYGTSSLERLYGVNGVGRAFEWDGSVLTPIEAISDAALDKPAWIAEFSKHLFLGYGGGALMVSGTGLPLSFDSNDGAFELGLGVDITGLGRL